MNAHKFEWEPGDLAPAWLSLAPSEQRLRLAQLLSVAAGQEAEARRRLHAVPWPKNQEQASDRVAAAIEFLVDAQA